MMKKIFICIGIAFAIVSCEQTYDIKHPENVQGKIYVNSLNLTNDEDSPEELSFEFMPEDDQYHRIRVATSIYDGNLNSICAFQNKDMEWINVSEFNFKNDIPDYKMNINSLVETEAEDVKNSFKNEQILKMERTLDAIPKLLLEELGGDSYSKESSLALFYHLGVLKSARRSINKNLKDCNCSEFPSYINGEAPFFCSEDKIVSVNEVQELIVSISEKRFFANKQFIPEETFAYLSANEGEYISISIIDELYHNEFRCFFNKTLSKTERLNVINENSDLGEVKIRLKSGGVESGDPWPGDPTCFLYGVRYGSDCGCCGNYSGRCWTCSLACLIHDRTCTTCEPRWYCLPGCVPGPC